MKAIVTGAAGFIGSRLCRELVQCGYEVLGVDAFRSHYSPELKSLRVSELLEPSGIKLQKIDLVNFGAINELVSNFSPTTIFHLAAQPGVRVPIAQSENYIQDNLVAHSNIMQSAVMNGIPKVLYASSSSVYGDSSTPPYSESEMNLKPISLYGSTKFANEITSPNYVKNSETRSRGLRFFTVYGPLGRPDMAYFRLIASALDAQSFELFGNGEVKRDFTYVDDVTRMTIALDSQLSETPPSYSDVVNIGGGAPRSLAELISCVEEHVGRKINVIQKEPNLNDTAVTVASTERITSLIGMHPTTSLTSGIASVVEWASQNSTRERLRDWINSTK